MFKLHMNSIKTAVFVAALLMLSGCATPMYLPSLGNVKQYSGCDPVYSSHVPSDVMKYKVTYQALTDVIDKLDQNPTLISQVMPPTSTFDTLGKNATNYGMGFASIVEAFKGDLSASTIISTSIVSGIQALGNIRSESKDQDRIDACQPKDSKLFVFMNGDALVVSSKADTIDASAVKEIVTAALQNNKIPPNRISKPTSNTENKESSNGNV